MLKHTALIMLAMLALGACTDKDREIHRRTSDGSDTFKFDPDKDPEPAKGPKGDGLDTFKFDPNKMPGTATVPKGDGLDTFKFDPSQVPTSENEAAPKPNAQPGSPAREKGKEGSK